MSVDVGLSGVLSQVAPPRIDPIELTNDFICECSLALMGGDVELAGGVDPLDHRSVVG
jgi:hypothetical protein